MRSEALPHVTTVLGHVRLNSETFELICSRPEGFQFVAGQHVTLSYGREEREYTILSPPETPELRFLIKRVAGGALSNALGELAPGSLLGISKAKGYMIRLPMVQTMLFAPTNTST